MELISRMLSRNGILLTATPGCIDWIADHGFDPQYGARPIKRVIQKEVLNELSKMILKGSVDKDAEIEIDEVAGSLVFRNH